MKSLPIIAAVLALGVINCQAEDAVKPVPPPGVPPHAEGDKKPKGDKPHMSPEDAFKKMDADNSGSVSLAEFLKSPRAQKDPAKAEAMYKKMNTTNDDKLTLDQFKAARKEGGDRKGPKPGGPKPDAPKPE